MTQRDDLERARLDAGDRRAWRRLLRGLKARDNTAITVFVGWMRPRLVRRFCAKGVVSADAECLAQDVLISFIWRYADRLERPQAIDAYLRLMSATALRRYRRDQARLGRLPTNIEQHVPAALGIQPGIGIDMRRLSHCLSTLTARIRGRLQKHFHLGQGYAEIGRSEDCTGQAVRQSVVAGLATLRACIEAES